MAEERKDIEGSKNETSAGNGETPPQPRAEDENPTADAAGSDAPASDATAGGPGKNLPAVDSPSISPATPEPDHAETAAVPSAAQPSSLSPIVPELFDRNRPGGTAGTVDESAAPRSRTKGYAVLAASVMFAAVIGAVAGTVTTTRLTPPPQQPPAVNTALQDENKALQKSVAKLNKDVTTLRANLDAANKSSQAQIAKLNERLAERLNRESADVTGSISAPQTVTPTQTPMPTPRPAPRIAAVEAAPTPPSRPPVVAGWSIRDARGGFVYVEGRGEVYQVVPGAPLPGIGPVEAVRRLDGRWVVFTPRGIIVSQRDRHYFE